MRKSRLESTLSEVSLGWWDTPIPVWGFNFYTRNCEDVNSAIDYLVATKSSEWEELRPELFEEKRREAPNMWPIRHYNPLKVWMTRPMSTPAHKFEVQLMPDIMLRVDPVAYRDLTSQVEILEPDSAPYHIFTFNHWGSCCIPQEFARALKNYDWRQHELYVVRCLREHEENLRKLGKHPLIGLQPRPGKNVTEN